MFKPYDPNVPDFLQSGTYNRDPSTWLLYPDNTVDIGGSVRVDLDVATSRRRSVYADLIKESDSDDFGRTVGMRATNVSELQQTAIDAGRTNAAKLGYDPAYVPSRPETGRIFDEVFGDFNKDVYEGVDPFDAAKKHFVNLPYPEEIKKQLLDVIEYDRNPVFDENGFTLLGRPEISPLSEEDFTKLYEVDKMSRLTDDGSAPARRVLSPEENKAQAASLRSQFDEMVAKVNEKPVVSEPKVIAAENVSPKIDSTPIKKEMYHGAAPGSNLTAGTIDPLARSSGRTPLPAFTLGDYDVAESYAKTGGVGMERTAEGPLYKVGLEFDSEKRIVGAYDAAPDDFIEFMRNSLPEEGVPNYVDEFMAKTQGQKTVRFRDIFDEKLMDLAPDERNIYGVMNALSDVHEFYRPLESYDYQPRAQGSIEAKRYGIDALTWDDYGDEVLGLLDPDDLRSGTGRKNISYIEQIDYTSNVSLSPVTNPVIDQPLRDAVEEEIANGRVAQREAARAAAIDSKSEVLTSVVSQKDFDDSYSRAMKALSGSDEFVTPDQRFLRGMVQDIFSIGSSIASESGYDAGTALNPKFRQSLNNALVKVFDQISDPENNIKPLNAFLGSLDEFDLPEPVRDALGVRATLRRFAIDAGKDDETILESLPRYPGMSESDFDSRFIGQKLPSDMPKLEPTPISEDVLEKLKNPPTSLDNPVLGPPKPGALNGINFDELKPPTKPKRSPVLDIGSPVQSPTQVSGKVVTTGTGTPQAVVTTSPAANVTAQVAASTTSPISSGAPSRLGGTAGALANARQSAAAVTQGVSGAKNLKMLGVAALVGLGAGGVAMSRRTQQDNIDRRLEMQRKGIIS